MKVQRTTAAMLHRSVHGHKRRPLRVLTYPMKLSQPAGLMLAPHYSVSPDERRRQNGDQAGQARPACVESIHDAAEVWLREWLEIHTFDELGYQTLSNPRCLAQRPPKLLRTRKLDVRIFVPRANDDA